MKVYEQIHNEILYNIAIHESDDRDDYLSLDSKTASGNERVKLDQVSKVLFSLSQTATVKMINHLFGQNYNLDEISMFLWQ